MKQKLCFNKAFEHVNKIASKEEIKTISLRLLQTSSLFLNAKKNYLEQVASLEKTNSSLVEFIRSCPYDLDLKKYLKSYSNENKESITETEQIQLKNLIKSRARLICILFRRLKFKKEMRTKSK